jgi:FkbM family methyltransferase
MIWSRYNPLLCITAVLEAASRIDNVGKYVAGYMRLTKGDKMIVYRMKDGINYKVRSQTSDSAILAEVVLLDMYRLNELNLQPNATVVDVGAHIGLFSLTVSKMVRNVYSFEPMPENFDLLKHNINVNAADNIIAENVAVGGKDGTRKLYISNNQCGGHTFIKTLPAVRDSNMFINVKTKSLEHIVDSNGIDEIDLLKLDCEGSEYEILFNCPDKVLKRINAMSIECHNLESGFSRESVRRFLKRNGFDITLGPLNKEIGMLYAKRRLT